MHIAGIRSSFGARRLRMIIKPRIATITATQAPLDQVRVSDVALRRAMKCGRLQRSVKNIGGRPFSFIYDANFMRSKLLRFSAFDVRDNVLESEYILGNLFICAEDMESNLNDDDFQFIVKQSVAARWGATGASMPIVLIGDKEFESTDENAAQLEKINELLDIVREMAKDD